MRKQFITLFVMVGLVVFGAMDTKAATFTVYTNEAVWEAAVGSWVTEPFNATGLQPFTGVVTSNGAIGPTRGVLSGSVWTDFVATSGGDSTTFSYIPGPFLGGGALWDTSVNAEGQGLTITANLQGGGSQFIAEISDIDGTFWGFTSDQNLASFTITVGAQTGDGETFDMDNLKFGPVAGTVPEPTTMLLLGSGLIGLVGYGRKKLFKK